MGFWKSHSVQPSLSFLSDKTGAVPSTPRGWDGPDAPSQGPLSKAAFPCFRDQKTTSQKLGSSLTITEWLETSQAWGPGVPSSPGVPDFSRCSQFSIGTPASCLLPRGWSWAPLHPHTGPVPRSAAPPGGRRLSFPQPHARAGPCTTLRVPVLQARRGGPGSAGRMSESGDAISLPSLIGEGGRHQAKMRGVPRWGRAGSPHRQVCQPGAHRSFEFAN